MGAKNSQERKTGSEYRKFLILRKVLWEQQLQVTQKYPSATGHFLVVNKAWFPVCDHSSFQPLSEHMFVHQAAFPGRHSHAVLENDISMGDMPFV